MSSANPSAWHFSANERRALLDGYFADLAQWHALELTPQDAADASPRGAAFTAETLITRLTDAVYRYSKRVPVVPLSRCPFLGETVTHSLDPFGIDGLWWNYEAPVRPIPRVPPTFFALTGALALGGAVEWTPFLVKPGPGVPFVVPRMLAHPAIKAVVSSVPVGNHTAYPIFYFTDDPSVQLERINTWGTSRYDVYVAGIATGWNERIEEPGEYDFELAPWIEQGKLLWIAPEDASLTLRNDAAGCPYCGLSGTREIQRIELGKAWTPSTLTI